MEMVKEQRRPLYQRNPAHYEARIRRANAMASIAASLGATRSIAESWGEDEWRILDEAYCRRRQLREFRASSGDTRAVVVNLLPHDGHSAGDDDPFAGL